WRSSSLWGSCVTHASRRARPCVRRSTGPNRKTPTASRHSGTPPPGTHTPPANHFRGTWNRAGHRGDPTTSNRTRPTRTRTIPVTTTRVEYSAVWSCSGTDSTHPTGRNGEECFGTSTGAFRGEGNTSNTPESTEGTRHDGREDRGGHGPGRRPPKARLAHGRR